MSPRLLAAALLAALVPACSAADVVPPSTALASAPPTPLTSAGTPAPPPLASARADGKPDLAVVYRIKDEAYRRGKVMDHLFWLTDVNGPRLTASPGWKSAADWVVRTLASWNVVEPAPRALGALRARVDAAAL